jgi:hypothetical protein
MSETVPGVKYLVTFMSMLSLAAIIINQGRLKEAEELSTQVVGLQQDVLGVENPDTMTGMSNRT